MNTNDLTYLLNKPEAINEMQTMSLEAVLHEFPYFQSTRALHLKGLFNQDSFRYNYELKKTAAHTADRSILFDFITSEKFETLQINLVENDLKKINDINVIDGFVIEEQNISKDGILTEKEFIEEKLEIGKPINFIENEKHSFQEWLKLTTFAPIDRENIEEIVEFDIDRQKKIELIDKFIELNPKISPVKENTKTPANINVSKDEPTHLMTETLAKVYLEQKKYNKAIQAYDILILKYPEKSSFFADRIKNIKELQQNNN